MKIEQRISAAASRGRLPFVSFLPVFVLGIDIEISKFYDAYMRITLTIDDDIFRIVERRARESGQSVGAVLSRLARRGLESSGYDTDNSGLPLFAVSGNAPLFGPEETARGMDEV
jgi:hypothetical protein